MRAELMATAAAAVFALFMIYTRDSGDMNLMGFLQWVIVVINWFLSVEKQWIYMLKRGLKYREVFIENEEKQNTLRFDVIVCQTLFAGVGYTPRV